MPNDSAPPAAGHTQLSAFRINRRFLAYLAPRWRRVTAIYTVMLLGTATLTAIPQLVRWIVDHGIARQDLQVVWRAVGILLLLALLRAVLAFLMGRWTEMVSQGVAATLRQEMFTRFTAMSVSLISRMESGQLLQRAVQDVERIRFLTGRAVLRVVDAAVLFLATLAVLIGMNPVLGVLALATMPLLVIRGYQYGRRQRPLASRLQQQLGVLTSLLEQNLRGVRLVKAFAQERTEIERFGTENDAWFDVAAQNARLTAVNSPAARPDCQLRPGTGRRRRWRVHHQRQPHHRRVGGVHHLPDPALRADSPRGPGDPHAGHGGGLRRTHRGGARCPRRGGGAPGRTGTAADSRHGTDGGRVLPLCRQRRGCGGRCRGRRRRRRQ